MTADLGSIFGFEGCEPWQRRPAVETPRQKAMRDSADDLMKAVKNMRQALDRAG